MNILLDSWAWIEVFKGTEKGKEILEIVEGIARDENKIYTTTANLYEVYYRIHEDEGKEASEKALPFIEDASTVVEISRDIAVDAAKIRLNEGLRAIDAFVLAAARRNNAKVLTGDSHFKDLKDAIFIGFK